jgi:lysylphosphatidylglycerol synthetase-like protein (DUF2156 family)
LARRSRKRGEVAGRRDELLRRRDETVGRRDGVVGRRNETAGRRAPNGRAAMARGYARARERDEAARAALVPLRPGERPTAVTAAAILAGVIAAGNLILIAVGWEVDGERPIVSGLVFAGVLAVAAIGMWRVRYWAVLGFQVLLGVSLIFALLALLRASNFAGVVAAVTVVAAAGPLFWLLIRAMARIQMPREAEESDQHAGLDAPRR